MDKMKIKNAQILTFVLILALLILIVFFIAPILTGNPILNTKSGSLQTKQIQVVPEESALTSEQTRAAIFEQSTSPPGITDFYGNISNLIGDPAENETIVFALTEAGDTCGSYRVNLNLGVGLYGFLHCSCGGDRPPCDGDNIRFIVQETDGINRSAGVLFGDTTWDGGIHRVNLQTGACCNSNGCVSHNQCLGYNFCSYGELKAWCWKCGCPGGQICKKVGATMKCVGGTTPDTIPASNEMY